MCICLYIYLFKIWLATLADVFQWLEHQLMQRRITGFIPSQGHIAGLQVQYPAWVEVQ